MSRLTISERVAHAVNTVFVQPDNGVVLRVTHRPVALAVINVVAARWAWAEFSEVFPVLVGSDELHDLVECL